jgi:nicotinamide N-methyltransferase
MADSVPNISVGLTEDSDTDFQSAYSASPRESYGSFESGKTKLENDDDAALLSQFVPENHEERFSAIPKTRRERVSSTATATTKREKSEPRSSLTTTALPSRSRITTK